MLLLVSLLACSSASIKLGTDTSSGLSDGTDTAGGDTASGDNGAGNGGDTGAGNNGGDTGSGNNGGDTGSGGNGGTDTGSGGNGGDTGSGGNGGTDTGGGSTPNPAAGTYRSTINLDIPDYGFTICTSDIDVVVSDTGDLSASGSCDGDSGYGPAFSIPTELLGVVAVDGSVTGTATFTIDMGRGASDVSADMTGTAARGSLSLDFPFTLDFGRDTANVDGTLTGTRR